MNISLLLEMASSAGPDREAVVDGARRASYEDMSDLADGGAALIVASAARHVVYVGTGGILVPLLLFSSARAAVPVTPLNYRLSVESIRMLIARLHNPLLVVDDEYRDVVDNVAQVVTADEFIAEAAKRRSHQAPVADSDRPAVVLFTSGTTSEPKAVELSHNNLTSYITSTVDFGSAQPDDVALVCVPPYHIAGVSAALSNVYACRRVVYLRQFDAREWVRLVREEGVTTATVVPTMLDRIVSELQTDPTPLPTLRNLAYGGSKVSLPLLRRALELLPGVGFVNAYGLTETSSTIAVLTPQDHHEAVAATDRAVAARLGSVGRPVPGVEMQIRAADGVVLDAGHPGELFVRGAQVSGRYAGVGSALDADGWFATRDRAWLDADGYLFLGGRTDDTIIRGGENIAPAEIEHVLVEHPMVREVVVVGADDSQWGQIIVAVVVPRSDVEVPDAEELRMFVRDNIRGSRTPDKVVFREELPTNATGKVLRKVLVAEINSAAVQQ